MVRVGQWRVSRELNRLEGPDGARELEPKVMDLLLLLIAAKGATVSREELRQTLWPGAVVGEDAIARCVFKLRKALGDESASPKYIATVPKRGYRLVAPIKYPRSHADRRPPFTRAGALAAAFAALLLAAPAPPTAQERDIALARAADYYARYDRAANETAGALYRQVLARDPASGPALAGLAMVEVQRLVRWSEDARGEGSPTLAAALADGRLESASARRRLAGAEGLIQLARARQRQDAAPLQALGLVRSAQGDLAGAALAYRQVLRREPDNVGAMINLGDVLGLAGESEASLGWLERAYDSMSRSYGPEVQRLAPWQPLLGVEIARRHERAGRLGEAERWLARVLRDAPLDIGATQELARMRAAQRPI